MSEHRRSGTQLVAVLGVGVVDPQTPVVAADDQGLTRGDGCFEGCRVITDASGLSVVDKLHLHLARFARSAAALEIEFDRERWREFVLESLRSWTTPGETAMKLMLTRGRAGTDRPTGLLTVTTLSESYPAQRRDGVSAITLNRGTAFDAFDQAPWLLGGVKTLSYAVNMAAGREAVRRGADDVIFLSTDGFVLEAPTASVVWAHGRTLVTTPLGASGILGGTTQQRLFEHAAADGWRTAVKAVQLAELIAADVVWLISSVRGPVDVVSIDGIARERDLGVVAEIAKLTGF